MWLAWLVPYIIGMLVGIPMIHLQAVCAIGTSVVVVAVLASCCFRGGEGSCAYRRALGVAFRVASGMRARYQIRDRDRAIPDLRV